MKKQPTHLELQEMKAWRSAWLSEIQAAAIYEAECWVLEKTPFTSLRKKTLKEFREILAEENHHADGLNVLCPGKMGAMDGGLELLNRFAGTALGFSLSWVPSPISWMVHCWAELQASAVYREAAKTFMRKPGREALLCFLKEAEIQEFKHAQRFKELLLQ